MPANHVFTDEKGIPSIFPSTTAVNAFEGQDPGTVGTRGIVRVPGSVNFDASISKSFRMPFEGHRLIVARRSVQRLQPRQLHHAEPQPRDSFDVR